MGQHKFEDLLVCNFELFLEAYTRYCPFKKYGQLQYHVATIELRKQLGSTRAAIYDWNFMQSLYNTLQAWGIGARASNLKPLDEFTEALQKRSSEIAEFEQLNINSMSNVAVIAKKLERLIYKLDIVDNKSRIVAGTKALHHLLPELVVPIDRKYTQHFFGWHNPQFQNFPQECINQAYKFFVRIASTIDLSQYVNDGWFSSQTKVIDNAIVGFWRWVEFDASKILANNVETNAPKTKAEATTSNVDQTGGIGGETMIDEISRKIHEAALCGQKIAMFHYQVLVNAEKLSGLDPVSFCKDVDVPETYATEFRKMLSLSKLMKEKGAIISIK